MDFFKEYLKFVGASEAPTIYHRWCCLSMIGSSLGREAFLPFGHDPIYANMYTLLLGAPGARKSSAIRITKKILTASGYSRFAKDKTSKERFFLDMVNVIDINDPDLESLVLDAPSEIFIANGEFLDFIGQGNMDFLTALTNLWDNLPFYEHPKLHGKSVVIHKPTINILGGATVKGLGMMIPAEALGTGILSRLLLIYSDPTDKKITFPAPVPEGAEDQIVDWLLRVKREVAGEITRSPEADKIFDKIYNTCPGIEDGRFSDYSSRRLTHLLKLAMIVTASDCRTQITAMDALVANTILHAAEIKMTKALGEFGKSKYSDVSNTIIEVLGKAHKPMTHNELWKTVCKDLSDVKELGTVMKNLITSEKAQVITVAGKQGYMTKHREHREWSKELLLEDYLTVEESF